MTRISYRPLLAGLLLISAVALSVGACSGGGATTTTAPQVTDQVTGTAATVADNTTTGSTVPAAIDELSTFKSKDPFRQQALPPTTRVSTTNTSSTTSTTAHGNTTTTTVHRSTTTTHPSSVTTPLHSLKVLSVDQVNGEAVVTFQVDGTVYEDKHEGSVVSTSWGQIEVVDIDAANQRVVFLHGSETRTLSVGESFLK